MAETPGLRALLEAGVHFGHSKSRRHPKAERYIFTTRDNINIINLEQTAEALDKALKFVEGASAAGKTVLFVGTKRQAKMIITEHCKHSGIPYVAERWVGGLLTNFAMIKQSIDHMLELERQKEGGAWEAFPKHEVSKLDAQLLRLKTQFDGVRNLAKAPDVLFIIDLPNEKTAIREAKTLGLPVVALSDTNADPTGIDYPIPANDDATKALELMITLFAQAVEDGRKRAGDAAAKIAAAKEAAPVAA